RRPLAWSLGAAGVGFFVGYGVAAAIKGDGDSRDYVLSTSDSYARPLIPASVSPPHAKPNGKDEGPGVFERFRETPAYDRLSREAGALGDRLVEELSTTAQQIVLPAL